MTVSARKRSSSARAAPADQPEHFPLTISRPELIVNGSDREFRHLVHSLFGFLARHEQIRGGHAKVIGLAGIEYTALISIAHLSVEGAVNVKTVADHLHVSGAFVTSVVSRLLNLGLIHKKTDASDRRRVTLTVSDKGHGALARLAPVQRQVNDVEFDGLSREEFRFLLDIVERMIASGDRAVALQNYLLSSLGGANASVRRRNS